MASTARESSGDDEGGERVLGAGGWTAQTGGTDDQVSGGWCMGIGGRGTSGQSGSPTQSDQLWCMRKFGAQGFILIRKTSQKPHAPKKKKVPQHNPRVGNWAIVVGGGARGVVGHRPRSMCLEGSGCALSVLRHLFLPTMCSKKALQTAFKESEICVSAGSLSVPIEWCVQICNIKSTSNSKRWPPTSSG